MRAENEEESSGEGKYGLSVEKALREDIEDEIWNEKREGNLTDLRE